MRACSKICSNLYVFQSVMGKSEKKGRLTNEKCTECRNMSKYTNE